MFTFVSGNLALDYAGTVEARTTEYRDRLVTGPDLADWLVAAGLLDDPPACDAETLRQAVALREAIYRLGAGALHGEPADPADLRRLNEVARNCPPRSELTADATVRRTGTVADALAAIARSAIELLGGPDRPRVKQCGRDACTRLYIDTSRGGSRRWCDMTICGNRAKSATFRQRHGV
ncbi:ABATE domain-containing protein [Nocardia sp. BMG111209]|uniref:CGNR zinc finger domain-containing protein n=1 Tax=Nocardia sp. BMG111209 TaxID=1160137 RepID=UPI00036A857C|nr:ABATE domain-containing protein [Nocardia sp. BMG111209]